MAATNRGIHFQPMSASSSIANKAALLISCPQCNNLVTLPQAISLQAIVRCPICHSTFPVHTALPSDVPELQVVNQEHYQPQNSSQSANSRSTSVDEIRLSPDEKLPVAKALRDGARRRRHGRHHGVTIDESTEVAQPIFDSQVGETIRSTDEQTQAILAGSSPSHSLQNHGKPIYSSHSRSSRNRTAKFNTLVEVAKVVAGALLALPVSQLIIWWGLGLDPFSIGPRVGQVAPFVVPEKLRHAPPSIETPQQQKTGP